MSGSNTHSAPPGYEHNYAAILDLIRFGPAIWNCSQMQALLFHAERSTAYGKQSDKHSEKQAIEGIYSTRSLSWVRGPSGMSRATWYRANTELEIDDAHPEGNRNAVLRARRLGDGRGRVTEYEIDWRAVKARIKLWKEGSQIETLSQKEGSHVDTLKGLKLRPFSKKAITENKGPSGGEGSQFETHSQSLDLKSDLTVGQDTYSRSVIAAAIEAASGDRPRTDGLIGRIIEVGQKLRLPEECMVRWIHDFCHDRRGTGYRVEAGLIGTSVGKSIVPWMNKLENQHFVAECRRKIEVARNTIPEVHQMQPPEADKPPAEEGSQIETLSASPTGPDTTCRVCNGAGQCGYADNRSACGHCKGTGIDPSFFQKRRGATR